MVIGFGENSVDYVYRLPRYPHPGTAASKIEIERRDVRPGGQVTTTLAACASLGLPTRYLGAIGSDEAGTFIRAALAERGVDVSRARVRDVANRYAVVLIDSSTGERVVLWQREPQLAIPPGEFGPEDIRGASLVHVDATNEAASIDLANIARAAGIPVTCDIDTVTPLTAALVDAVSTPIVAEHVLTTLTGESDIERALRRLRSTHPGRLVVTLGAAGAAMLDDERFLRIAGVRVAAVDTTGAGDVFRGAFIYALLKGLTAEQILRFANAAAAVSCTREGAMQSVPTLDDVHFALGGV